MKAPIDHLSWSAIRTYLVDRYAFARRYIDRKPMDSIGASMLEGKVYHIFLEEYLNDNIANITMDDASSIVDKIFDQAIIWQTVYYGKKTEEKSREIVKNCVQFYLDELPGYITKTQGRLIESMMESQILPWLLPIKGVIDVAYQDNGETILVDHKLVASYDMQEDMNAGYELQASSYFLLYEKSYGIKPKKMIFEQMKKSKNRDGSPQIYNYEVLNSDILLNRFKEIYRRINAELTGELCPMPNPFDISSDNSSWVDFCLEVDPLM